MPLHLSLIFLILLLVSSFSIFAFRYSFFLFLKCLLASCLTLFRLSTFPWFGSYTHCIFAYLLGSQKPKHSSSNHGLCHFNLCVPRLPLADVLIFFLMFSQVLFMSSLSFKFSKAANLFEISIWYCFLTSSSLRFLRLNLTTSNFGVACLLAANLSLTFATIRELSVSLSAPLKDHTLSILECHLLYVNMWSICLWVFPSGEVQVYLWMFRCGNIMLLTTRFFDVAKFTVLTSLSLLSWCSHSVVGLKIFFLPNFSFKSPYIIFMWYLGKWLKTSSNSS